MAVKNELDEFVHQMKQGQMNSETDINFKVDLLRQIMEECLEQITYTDKEGFIG